MKDFVEEFYYHSDFDGEDGFDRERAERAAVAKLLPVIMERELTQRQSVCLRYHYVQGKSQQEIAELLQLSQPTVSRHLQAAKNIVNTELAYCYAAMHTALNAYDRLVG